VHIFDVKAVEAWLAQHRHDERSEAWLATQPGSGIGLPGLRLADSLSTGVVSAFYN
jgi:hypothetical protein